MRYVVWGSDGTALQVGECAPEHWPSGAVAAPEGVLLEDIAGGMRRGDGTIVARPLIDLTVARDADAFTLTGVPAGSEVEVVDVEAREALGVIEAVGGAVEFALPDQGHYRLHISPPSPWVPLMKDLVVDAP